MKYENGNVLIIIIVLSHTSDSSSISAAAVCNKSNAVSAVISPDLFSVNIGKNIISISYYLYII